MKPQNWGAYDILVLAVAVGLGMALGGSFGKLLDPVLRRIEGMFGNGRGTASA